MSTVYRPPRFTTPIDLDLSRNEGRPSVFELSFTSEEVAGLTSRYPDTSRLRRAVAGRHGLSETQVLVTAGGDDALFRCLLFTAGGRVVATTPSFEMIRSYASQARSPLIEIPWWSGDFPVGEFIEVEADAAVVVSPNNPTGSAIGSAELRKVAGGFPLVILDAAYAEFADEDLTSEALGMGNVVVVRTMSKAFGLAGLRVGYLLGPPELVEQISGFGSPYALSSLSASLAADVLTNDPETSSELVDRVGVERDRLWSVLDELDCAPLPSQANFVLATDLDAAWTIAGASSLGIGLRRFEDDALARCVRIGLPGDPEAADRLCRVLRSVLAPEALLFDMDGVLADVRGSYRAAIIETAESFGVEVTFGDIAAAKAAGSSSDDWALTRRLCVAGGVDVPLEEVKERFEAIYQGSPSRPGLKETETLLVDPARLGAWAERLPLGIVTARPRSDAEEFLDRFDIARHFSTVVTREDAPSKPEPAPVLVALGNLGVTSAWMVGDTVDDLRSARGAGVVPIGVVAQGGDLAALADAARVLNDLDELEEVLDVAKI